MAHIETIGDRIARLRRDKNIPQYLLAGEIGLHPSSLNQIEKGHRTPKAETVAKLAKALDVSRDFLWDGAPAVATPLPDRDHGYHAQAVEVSALVTQAVHTEIRAVIVDILNALSESLAATGRPAATDSEDRRPEAQKIRTRRH